jgi:hypothetical protein
MMQAAELPLEQSDIATYTVTLIFSLSTFALFWSPRARTSTAVRAEGLIEVVGHWHRDKRELREDAPVFPSAQWRALAKFFLRKSKVQTTIISTAAALRARRSRKFLAIAPGPAIRSSLRIELGKGGPRG